MWRSSLELLGARPVHHPAILQIDVGLQRVVADAAVVDQVGGAVAADGNRVHWQFPPFSQVFSHCCFMAAWGPFCVVVLSKVVMRECLAPQKGEVILLAINVA